RRIPNQNLADFAFAAIDAALVPAPARFRLDDERIEIGRADMMGLRPPTPDAVGENLERAVRRGAHAHAFSDPRPHGRLIYFVHSATSPIVRLLRRTLAARRPRTDRAICATRRDLADRSHRPGACPRRDPRPSPLP